MLAQIEMHERCLPWLSSFSGHRYVRYVNHIHGLCVLSVAKKIRRRWNESRHKVDEEAPIWNSNYACHCAALNSRRYQFIFMHLECAWQ